MTFAPPNSFPGYATVMQVCDLDWACCFLNFKSLNYVLKLVKVRHKNAQDFENLIGSLDCLNKQKCFPSLRKQTSKLVTRSCSKKPSAN